MARHLTGDTAATQTLMNKALAEGRMTQRMTLFWEAVERAPIHSCMICWQNTKSGSTSLIRSR